MISKYFVVHISQAGEGAALVKELFEFDTLEAAKSNHYYFLSCAYANTALTYFMSEIISPYGAIIISDVHADEAEA